MLRKIAAFLRDRSGGSSPVGLVLAVVFSALLLAALYAGLGNKQTLQEYFRIMAGGPLGK